MVDPKMVKIAVDVVTDKEKRKKVITSVVVVIIVCLLLILIPIYFITAPLSAVKDIITGNVDWDFIWDLRKLVWTDEEKPSAEETTYSSTTYHGELAMPVNRQCKDNFFIWL